MFNAKLNFFVNYWLIGKMLFAWFVCNFVYKIVYKPVGN